MVMLVTLFFIQGAGLVGSMPSIGSPENITIMFLSPTSVKVSWTTSIDLVEKYDVTYKPTDARVVAVVAGNSDSVTLSGLLADTQYQVTVTAVRSGKKYRSRPIVFRTLEAIRPPEVLITGSPPGVKPLGSSSTSRANNIPNNPNMPPTYIQVRGIEVGIVVLVLMVWVGAIILFFNRWGKIRMLLPYQPDYKDTQLKVPGTGACSATATCQNQGASGFCCSQAPENSRGDECHLHRSQPHRGDDYDWRSRSAYAMMPPRSRINSAIYISAQYRSECEPLFGSQEHMGTSNFQIIRKARSADQLTTTKQLIGHRDENELISSTKQLISDDTQMAPNMGPNQLINSKCFSANCNNSCDSDGDLPVSNNLELPILSVSVASDRPFVEQYL
ncbi:uncharacterized protein LOC111053837 isoform X2 [Nilaparvata lugens]|uniref:uncharacterized protein LOC111053837 isoform X2 n=1 Tax=Nilaparvata lugens TaxID=108931 RepID=UPI00193CAE77|nr:uncharacterized protein LOC111053837 isoform X2 [Nilaparvata lugens]